MCENKVRTTTLIGIIFVLIVWLPVGYTGLPRTQEFSTHTIHLIDAGIVSYQPWTDQNGRFIHFANTEEQIFSGIRPTWSMGTKLKAITFQMFRTWSASTGTSTR